jgi:fructose-bisphosphate aldolase, class II
MTLCNPKSWIEQAQRGHFAVGAFNFNTLEQLQAIVLAAEAEKAPVIVQVSHRALQYLGSGDELLGLKYAAAIGKVAAESVSAAVALHVDHATHDEVLQAIDLGYTSVMFDGSLLPYDENVQTTGRLSHAAHRAGVCIEAELGEVPKPGVVSEHPDDIDALTDPDEAAAFVAATRIDALAVALGSVHAVVDKHVSLDLAQLSAIRTKVDLPLVLHGSSGVTDAHIAEGIRRGLSKINVATQLNKVFMDAARSALAENPGVVDPRKVLGPARSAMVAAVRERIRFFSAVGQVTS